MVCLNLYFFIKIKNPLSVIFLIAHFNYIILSVIFWLGLPFSYLEQPREREIYDTVILLDVLFFTILGLVFPREEYDFSRFAAKLWVPPSHLYWLGVIFIFINLLSVYKFFGMPYADIHDKHTIFSEIGWLFCGLALLFDKRLSLFSGRLILIGILIIISMLFGARLQISFTIIAILIRFVFPVSKGYLYISLFSFIAFGIFIGIIRDIAGLGGDLSTIFASINQGASLRTSSVYMLAVNEGFFSVGDRIFTFFATFVFGWVPSSLFDNIAHLNIRIADFSPIQGNGGLIGQYLFLFFGYFGGFLFAVFLGYTIKRASIKAPVFVAMIVITSYRWQLYNLLPIVKVMFLLLFISVSYKLLIGKVLVKNSNGVIDMNVRNT